jgi:uridine monophosphate synthetase
VRWAGVDTPSEEALITRELSRELFRIGAIRFGSFTLKDGRESPFYLDLRVLVSHPTSLARVGRALAKRAQGLSYDRIAGIPYAGLPIAVAMSLVNERPIVYPRKEAKEYGTMRAVEGEFVVGETALVVDDVITSGGAKLEAIAQLREVGLRVEDVLVVVDRSHPDANAMTAAGVRLHSVLRVEPLLEALCHEGLIDQAQRDASLAFVGAQGA